MERLTGAGAAGGRASPHAQRAHPCRLAPRAANRLFHMATLDPCRATPGTGEALSCRQRQHLHTGKIYKGNSTGAPLLAANKSGLIPTGAMSHEKRRSLSAAAAPQCGIRAAMLHTGAMGYVFQNARDTPPAGGRGVTPRRDPRRAQAACATIPPKHRQASRGGL